MRILLAFAIINCVSSSRLFSQENALIDDFSFEEVVQADALNKEELFQNAKHWILCTLGSGDNVMYMDEEELNTIIGTGNILLKTRTAGCAFNSATLAYKVTLKFKDNRYKYRIDNLTHRYVVNCGEYGGTTITAPLEEIELKNKLKTKIYEEVDQKLRMIIVDLKQSISESQSKEVW